MASETVAKAPAMCGSSPAGAVPNSKMGSMNGDHSREEMKQLEDMARVRGLAASGLARTIRRGRHLSQREVAKAARVNSASVSRWETGARSPRGDGALRWLKVLESLTDAAGR